jgi:hypothetical protein
MSRKLTYEHIKSIFEQGGCTLLSETYENCDKPLRYICECGNESTIRYHDFLQGKRCRQCGSRKASEAERLSYDYIKQQFKNKGCVLLSTEYINCEQKLDYICKCGNKYQMTYSSFRIGSKCPECLRREGSKKRLSYEYVWQYFEDHGCHLISTKYEGNHKPLDYICECGNKSKIAFSHFKNGKRCKECMRRRLSELHSTPDNEIVQLVSSANYTLNSIDKKIGENIRINITCDHGHTYNVTLSKFKSGQRCIKCYHDNNVGQNNPRWNPDLTDEERILNRDYKEYEDWRKTVYERDNYTCQICGKRGERLNAHHLENYADNEDLRLVVDNGISIHESHHKLFHKLFGNKNTTRQQFYEFAKTECKLDEQKRQSLFLFLQKEVT